MSYVTPVSLPSAGLYRDLTPPLVHDFVRFWTKRRVQFVTSALFKQNSVPLLQTTLLGISPVIRIDPYSPSLSVSQLYLYHARPRLQPLLKNCFSNLVTLYGSLDHIAAWMDFFQWCTVVWGSPVSCEKFQQLPAPVLFSACAILMTLRRLQFCLSMPHLPGAKTG